MYWFGMKMFDNFIHTFETLKKKKNLKYSSKRVVKYKSLKLHLVSWKTI